jgi:hypothetical protein
MAYERDSSDLAKAIRKYSPEGYIVNVQGIGRGTIGEVLQEYKTTTIYRVWLDNPQPFGKYADERDASDKKLTPGEFREKYRQMANYFPDELIERGLSDRDVMRWELENSGCFDKEGRIACLTVDWEYVDVIGFKRGMLVEYGELLMGETAGEGTGGRRVWPGRVVGTFPASENKEGKWPIVLLELFEPTPYFRTPESFNSQAVKPGYHSGNIGVISLGLYEALEDNAPKLIPKGGKWTEDKLEFYLEQPIEVSVIKKFCEKFYPNESRCLLENLSFFVVPMNVGEAGSWKPLRRTKLEEYESTTLVEMDIDPQIRESAR